MFEIEVTRCPACAVGQPHRCTYWVDGRWDGRSGHDGRVCASWRRQDLGQLGLARRGDRRGRGLEMEQ